MWNRDWTEPGFEYLVPGYSILGSVRFWSFFITRVLGSIQKSGSVHSLMWKLIHLVSQEDQVDIYLFLVFSISNAGSKYIKKGEKRPFSHFNRNKVILEIMDQASEDDSSNITRKRVPSPLRLEMPVRGINISSIYLERRN